VPQRGRIGAGAGVAVGKVLGRERATAAGVGYAATRLASGETVSAIAVANPSGDVIAEDGEVLGGPRAESGELLRSSELMRDMPQLPDRMLQPGQSTTLACVCTDAALAKRSCGIVARIASAGLARAVDPAFTPFDGDILFCLASGPWAPVTPGPAASWSLTVLGTAAASVTAAAIRDAVRQAISSQI
jgi:L-aminopeptidase/D-esterase-like protein